MGRYCSPLVMMASGEWVAVCPGVRVGDRYSGPGAGTSWPRYGGCSPAAGWCDELTTLQRASVDGSEAASMEEEDDRATEVAASRAGAGERVGGVSVAGGCDELTTIR